MRRWILGAAVAALFLPQVVNAACTKCIATEITAANASKHLFGGSDPGGGIGDWYLTNKKVEIVVDDIGTTDVPVEGGGTVPVNKTSSNAVATGGTLVDVGLYKQNNDQLPQSFNVAGLSLAQVLLFREGDESIWGASTNPCTSIEGANATCPADLNCGSITVFGIMLMPNVSTESSPTLYARTRYQVCDGEQQVQMRTEVWNQSGSSITSLPIIDIFLWGGRGLDAFLVQPGRGYNHPELDLGNATALVLGTFGPYWFAPGNVNKNDGKMSRGKKSKEVSYGHISGFGSRPPGENDADGPGGAAPTAIVGLGHTQNGLHGNLLSASILPVLAGPAVPDNASRIFNRALIVGKKNDGNSVTGDPTNPSNIFSQFGYPTGTFTGSVSPGSSEEGTITFIRTAGSVLDPPIDNNSPVTSIRAKGGFKITLPDGTYMARTVFPGRDDVIAGPFTIMPALNVPIPPIVSTSPQVGKITGLIADAAAPTVGMPAKVSLSPQTGSVSPGFRRDFEAMSFEFRTGMCSNNFSVECTSDATCGGGNTCFRTCSNKEPKRCTITADCTGLEVCASDNRCRSHACTTDLPPDCEPGNRCVSDTASILPESYPGGAAQLNVIYTHTGKINQKVRPGTYDVTVSRGPEYSIWQDSITVAANGTVVLNGGTTITLARVVDSSGWMSADFHIHSGRSLDSSAPLEARVRSFAAEGVEVMVSTDHDIVTDYNPAIKQLKLSPYIGSIVGNEVTTSVGTPPYFSNSWGHVNAWPQNFDPNERRSGGAEDENVSAGAVYERLRATLAATANKQCIGGTTGGKMCNVATDCKGGGLCTDVGTPVLQLNHVRAGVSGVVNIGLLDNVGFNPAAPITDCQKYPVICPTSQCFNGTNDGTACVTSATCTGGGVCGCASASVPSAANGCNAQLLDLNVVPQATLCTTPGCGSGFESDTQTRNIDADMMEIDNGGNASGWTGTKELRRDWHSLLNQNAEVGVSGNRHPMWGTGVSDTHRLIAELPGYSRTFVGLGDLPNPPISLDIKNFNLEVAAGNMFASTGPVLDVTADNGSTTVGLGETLDGSGGSVDVNIVVQAAPWIPIEEVRVIKNGCVVACFNSSTLPAVMHDPVPDVEDQTTTYVERFNATYTDAAVTGDSYYVVEASPNLPASGNPSVDPTVNAVVAGVFPYGFTNPIFADFDGGGYAGTGAPEPVCGALPAACSAGAEIVSAPATTMFAKNEVEKELGWLDRLLSVILPTNVGAHEDEVRPEDEAERLRQHEETIRKQGTEYFPRQFVVIAPPKATPAEETAPAKP